MMATAKLAVVDPGTPPERLPVRPEVQTGAHAINTIAGRLAGQIGRAWTTEPQVAAAEKACLEIARRAIALAEALREGGV